MAQSRRALFVAGIALAAASPAAAVVAEVPPNPDADLLALCAEFHQLHADTRSLPDTGDWTWAGAIDERWEVSDEIEDIRPATVEGHRAKATIALVLMEEQHGDSGDADIRFTLATLRDLLGGRDHDAIPTHRAQGEHRAGGRGPGGCDRL